MRWGSRLGRELKHRRALMRTQVTQLIEHERLKTTLPKAKELRRIADRMVTLAKRGGPESQGRGHHYRLAARTVRTPEALDKLFGELGPRYEERPGGYTRVLKAGHRRGDYAPMALVEFVDREGELREAAAPWRAVFEEAEAAVGSGPGSS